jgi:hypothetical protein
VTGELYTLGGGRVARVFLGVTKGIVDPKLTAEAVRDRFDQIRDEGGYEVPATMNDELRIALKSLS